MPQEPHRLSDYRKFPSSLKSREGWSRYFDLLRTKEPHLHQIEPTNHCPYSCIVCPRSTKMTRELGFMDIELYEKVIREVAGYSEPVRSKEIELFHFGESLLHPQVDKMVAIASVKNLRITMSVNAPQLSPHLAERILAGNPYKIILSLDGYDDESFKEIRGKNADFRKAVENIDRLVEIHKSVRSSAILIVRMIQIHRNKSHAESFREMFEKKGLKVEIRPFFPWTEKELVDLGEYDKYPPGMPCPFPWQYLVVQWNGDVVPCCRDFNAVNKVGNVLEKSLKEIWNGSEFEDFRNQHRTGQYGNNNFCKQCMEIYYTAPA
jgi:radical SAM protein with 4Fe4S-binding SPASM domain